MSKTNKEYQILTKNGWESIPEELFEIILTQWPHGGDVSCGVIDEMRHMLDQGGVITLVGTDYRIKPVKDHIKYEYIEFTFLGDDLKYQHAIHEQKAIAKWLNDLGSAGWLLTGNTIDRPLSEDNTKYVKTGWFAREIKND